MENNFNKKCPTCENLVLSKRTKYCSHACYSRKRKAQDKFCSNCNQQYFRKITTGGRLQSISSFERSRFCSIECSRENSRNPEINSISTDGKICSYCGETYQRKRLKSGRFPSWTIFEKSKFCSKECDSKYHEIFPRASKWSFEDISLFCAEFGGQIITKKSEYRSSNQLIEIKCRNGHITKTKGKYFVPRLINGKFSINGFCSRCEIKAFKSEKWSDKTYLKRTKNYEEKSALVKNYLQDFGAILIEEVNFNKLKFETKFKCRCKDGHLFQMSLKRIYEEAKCPFCGYKKRKYFTLEILKDFAQENGLSVLNKKKLRGQNAYYLFQCKKNHIFLRRYQSFKNTQTCLICDQNKNFLKHYCIERVRQALQDEGIIEDVLWNRKIDNPSDNY